MHNGAMLAASLVLRQGRRSLTRSAAPGGPRWRLPLRDSAGHPVRRRLSRSSRASRGPKRRSPSGRTAAARRGASPVGREDVNRPRHRRRRAWHEDQQPGRPQTRSTPAPGTGPPRWQRAPDAWPSSRARQEAPRRRRPSPAGSPGSSRTGASRTCAGSDGPAAERITKPITGQSSKSSTTAVIAGCTKRPESGSTRGGGGPAGDRRHGRRSSRTARVRVSLVRSSWASGHDLRNGERRRTPARQDRGPPPCGRRALVSWRRSCR